ncbi:MAG: DNA-3-methyladenine glycosylase 2 family protein [Clostridia bacterium]|nr:DNA-3-methyladenine glycosylase 2 family protein [Clostridia bacterium]
MRYTFNDNKVEIEHNGLFDLKKTFECGQCFRFDMTENNIWHGVVRDKEINLYEKSGKVVIYPVTKEEFESFWCDFFDLNRDYEAINNKLSENDVLKNAASYGKGIRILKQDPWEALCSFIISQNNNIPRIKGIIKRLCETYGNKLRNDYSFPCADVIAKLTVEDLAPLRSGFRAKYIIDAAKKVSSGEINLEEIAAQSGDEAREKLTTIYGVGKKVADCTLLFGMGHIDICPIDVWIKRALSYFFNNDFPECAKEYAGIAQQYLFYYARETKLNL